MKKLFNKSNIFTIPNLLSVIRIMLIPIIIWLYVVKKDYYGAIAVIVVSGLSDVADGIIARKFNMVSDLGKIIDPIADKLTQAALIICLAFKYKLMIGLIVLFAIRETAMSAMGIVTIKRTDEVCSARWYGKLNTVVLYSVMVLLILLPNISKSIANILIMATACIMIVTLVMYALFYRALLASKKDDTLVADGEVAV